MKVKARYDDEQLLIYREKSSVIAVGILMCIFCSGFGAVFTYLAGEDVFPKVFGSIFILFGVLLLVTLPKFYKKMSDEQGAVLLLANKDGLALAPLLNMPLHRYDWQDISRVVLAKKLVTKSLGEKEYCWNLAIVYFRAGIAEDNLNLIERSSKQVWRSPQGDNVSVVDIPKDDMATIEQALTKFARQNSDVSSCTRVLFDYIDDTEEMLA